ncbi:NADP-dependent oxidoreductase [Yinghuangia seranimata]|uniref:NADP-dependent oxidoreductase n=1 Tax=Yinghuangia seranimata TaxID=408067 RepID=UPI00248B8730|nr:NADP-dependent oxidoreductase [Yinghuangia seranimata]MDI2125870.1 NADP-dependent oxidoreductase [Yinghuangia seranimata]
MRAVAVMQLGAAPELVDVPVPEAGPGEVLVKVSGAGLNPFDWKVADGTAMADAEHTFPLVMGVDFAGIVAAVGPGTTAFETGDRVYGQTVKVPVGTGTYAEFVTVPEAAAVALAPSSITLVEAAAVPTAGMAALSLVETAGLGAGQTLLLIGASGGVGSFVTQLAAARGVRVIAATRGPQGQRMGSLGAAESVDVLTQDLAEHVRADRPDGVDALVDLVSDAAAFDAMSALVRDGGVAVTTRFAADPAATAARGVEGVNFNLAASAGLLERLAAELDTGRLRLEVEAQVPLADAPAAVARNKAGGARGKTVFVV